MWSEGNVRITGVILLIVSCLFATVSADDTNLPPKPEFNIMDILSIEHVTSETEEIMDDAGLGTSRLLDSPEEWEKKAQRHQSVLSDIAGDEQYPEPIKRIYSYHAAAAVTAEEIAIEKYRHNPPGVANDQKIAEAYVRLAQTYNYLSRVDPGYREYQLESLNAATDSLPTDKSAWEQKIALLNQMGRQDEAQEAQAEYDRIKQQTEAGYSLLGELLPVDPLVPIISAALGLGLVAVRRRKLQG